jgi:hypothetical protein
MNVKRKSMPEIDVRGELRRLGTLSVKQLQAELQQLTGEPPRSNNRVFLTKQICHQIQLNAYGGLSERGLARALELGSVAVARVRPTRSVHDAYKGAYEGAALEPPSPAQKEATKPDPLQVGALLTREYRGRTLAVRVLEHGFGFEGQVYSSLTAIATKVTGSHWNGKLFFGVTKRETSRRQGTESLPAAANAVTRTKELV